MAFLTNPLVVRGVFGPVGDVGVGAFASLVHAEPVSMGAEPTRRRPLPER